MYIKKLTIQGFKSYKDQVVVEPFSPGHNVVVGRNGSGKSNFFAAIRFVLNDAYSRLGQEERQALLHEGSGQPSISAFVEIVFDNADGRFPTGRDEVVLRRTIGLKKDEYSLDRKTVTKADVMNLLQAAGFSRSNPYYIVPQGRITALMNARDSERLELLKEVAGTRVYEEHRQESLKILEETSMKQEKITELLGYIEERLGELAEEKEELQRFQALDRQKRAAEYVLYSREATEIAESLQQLDAERPDLTSDHQNESNHSGSMDDLERQLEAISQLERELENQRAALQESDQDLEGAKIDCEELQRQRAHLSVIVADWSRQSTSHGKELEGARSALHRIEEEIARKETELATLKPRQYEWQQSHATLQTSLSEIEEELSRLQGRQGRFSQFSSAAERDSWLRGQIDTLQKTAQLQQDQLAEAQESLRESEEQATELSSAVEQLEETAKSAAEGQNDLDAAVQEARKSRDIATDARKELWRAEGKVQNALSTIQEQVGTAERSLAGLIDRSTWQGLQFLQGLKEKKEPSGPGEGLLGPLYELFEIPDGLFRPAVEALAGSSLFNVVCRDDTVATKCLESLRSANVGGRITFIPLNRISAGAEDDDYEDGDNDLVSPAALPKDCVRLIEKLSFSPDLDRLMESLFGRAVIVPGLDDSQLLRELRLGGWNAVTLDGDRMDRRGTLAGGSHDSRRSRLEAAARLSTWRRKMAEHAALLADLSSRLLAADQHVTRSVAALVALEQQRALAAPERLLSALTAKRQELEAVRRTLQRRQESLAAVAGARDTAGRELAALQAECGAPWTRLNAQDRARLSALQGDVTRITDQCTASARQGTELNRRITELESLLEENLRRRRLELLTRCASLSGLAGEQRGPAAELTAIEDALQGVNDRLVGAQQARDHAQSTITSLEGSLDKARQSHETMLRQVTSQSAQVERYMARRASLLQRREETARRLRELGIVDSGETSAVGGSESALKELSTGAVLAALADATAQLKAAFGPSTRPPPNRKAAELHAAFARQSVALHTRHGELQDSATSITDFVGLLDRRKDEAIHRTFTQVRENFGKIFERLCPQGTAELLMLREVDDEDAKEKETTGAEALGVRKSAKRGDNKPRAHPGDFTGIGIRASFTAKVPAHGLLLSQLSGGQKSLLALALIFAIQLVDPAPFYLFDEIDANLDAAARSAVADLIRDLADPETAGVLGGENARAAPPAQFITTTFRPELLTHANSFFGVSFAGRVSRVESITAEQARQFIESEIIGV